MGHKLSGLDIFAKFCIHSMPFAKFCIHSMPLDLFYYERRILMGTDREIDYLN